MESVRIGECVLWCGRAEDVLPTLEPHSVDAVITDPPYGKRFHDGGVSQLASEKWRFPSDAKFKGTKIIGDEKVDASVCEELFRILITGGAAYVFSQWMTEAEWVSGIRASGLVMRNRLIWCKPFHGAGDLQTTYGPQHESILFASKGRHELRGPRDGDVWLEPISSNGCFRKGQLHPNQKPLKLVKHLIQKSTDEGDTVCDPFMGSGSTIVAAAKLGRKAIGVEVEPKYFDIACRRIEEAVHSEPLFAEVG